MERRSKHFPEDCWESILRRLDHHHWEPLSLVSKTFLSVTNRLRARLKVINSSSDVLAKQLQRFPNLKKIDLSNSPGSLQDALLEVVKSKLDLEELNISRKDNPPILLLSDIGSKMKNIKAFHCSHSYLTDDDLVSLADYFTSVEDLDISQQFSQTITDKGIVALSLKLKRLRMINLSGNGKISDHSLISLSANCKLLTEVVLRHCPNVSQAGIAFVMGNSLRYKSLILASNLSNPLILTTPFSYPNYLTTIKLCRLKISNDLLHEMANANLPLKAFHLSCCTDFTLDGISSFLKAYQSLESLALDGTSFLTDESVTYLSQFMRKLISINLNSCFKLTISSFAVIALASQRIQHIETIVSSSPNEPKDLTYALNPAIKSTSLTCTSTILERLLHICPNLEVLNVTTLVHPYDLDIAYILNCCRKLRHLTINHGDKIMFSELEGEQITCKLESFSARKSRLDDQVLEMVGKRCAKLLKLDFEGCITVTEKGVRSLVENCRQLRYMNLNRSIIVNKEFVAWMVTSRPSLRQIVIPYPFDKDQANDFLVQGCIVHPGTWEKWCFHSFDL